MRSNDDEALDAMEGGGGEQKVEDVQRNNKGRGGWRYRGEGAVEKE